MTATHHRPLRIGYISLEDPEDCDAWSGSTHAMMQSLCDAGAIVEPIVVRTDVVEFLSKVQLVLLRLATHGKIMRNRETWYLRALSRRAAQLSRGRQFDAFVFPGVYSRLLCPARCSALHLELP